MLENKKLLKLSEVTGTRTKVKVVKNKVAPPFREAVFDIVYGKGISNSGCVLDLATDMNIVDKSGAWFAYNGQKIGQGRENAKLFLEENPDVMKEIEAKVRENYNMAFENSLTGESDSEESDEDIELDED